MFSRNPGNGGKQNCSFFSEHPGGKVTAFRGKVVKLRVCLKTGRFLQKLNQVNESSSFPFCLELIRQGIFDYV